MTKPTRPTDSMEVGLRVFGKVKVDDNIDGLDIDTTSEEVGTDKIAADTIAEVVEDTVTMGLEHLCVRIEAGIAKLCYFLGQELDAVGRVAEDNRLIDLQLGEEGIKAMHLLPLFDVGIILGNTTES